MEKNVHMLELKASSRKFPSPHTFISPNNLKASVISPPRTHARIKELKVILSGSKPNLFISSLSFNASIGLVDRVYPYLKGYIKSEGQFNKNAHNSANHHRIEYIFIIHEVNFDHQILSGKYLERTNCTLIRIL